MKSDAVPMPTLRPKWKRWLIDSAVARIVIFVLFAMVIGTWMTIMFKVAGWMSLNKNDPLRIACDLLLRVVPIVAAYLAIVLLVERRRVDELALRQALPYTAAGFAGGALLIGSVVLALWLAGGYEVTAISTSVNWARSLLIFGLATAIAEEIIFRGVLFRILDEAWGVRAALTISALFFGFAHLFNDNATVWTSFAIAVEAGILLGVVYHVTKSLWPCIGMHMSWNFVQGSVVGSPVSGIATDSSWIKAKFSGPEWLTGGPFGLEASVLTVLLALLFAFLLLRASKRREAQNAPMAAGAA